MSRRPRQSDADATVTFTYESAYNQIVQPGSYASLSQYFISHWLPAISPAGLKILMRLRALGYYDPKKAFQRGDIDIEQKELAALSGLSLSTLKRAFLDDPILTSYVQRVFQVKRDPHSGRIIKEHYVYVVKMDDVLIPADAARLEEMLKGQEKGNPPIAQYDPSGQAPIGQNDLSVVHNDPPIAQNELWVGQNDLSLNRSLHTLTTSNTPNTSAPRSEFFASLVPEKEKEPKDLTLGNVLQTQGLIQAGDQDAFEKECEKGGSRHSGGNSDPHTRHFGGDTYQKNKQQKVTVQTLLPFASLPEAEQAPWLAQAENELRENFGLAAWLKTAEKARAGLRRQRAQNLWTAARKGGGV